MVKYMNTSSSLGKWCVVMVVLGWSVMSLSAQGGDLSARLQSVGKLVGESSAARRIAASDNAAAMDMRARADGLLMSAREAHAAGKLNEAGSLLDQASRTMFEAVRLLDTDQSLVDKQGRDFDARLESITALCEAYDRISVEKGRGTGADSDLYPIVHKKLDAAKQLREAGRVTEGRGLLDEAYVAAKVGIEHLRGGDTLVRELDFKSSEEEYDYEIDRNDTHRMLVQVLLKEKMGADNTLETRISRFMDKAAVLRGRAEREAVAGNYEQAVRTLEESTHEIVKAIRSSGIYIPG